MCYVVEKAEHSVRALNLTTEMVTYNPSDYTAWYHRRRCLEEVQKDAKFESELEFTAKGIATCPKCYQVWHHRRWLMQQVLANVHVKWGSTDSKVKVLQNEKTFTEDILKQDPKKFQCVVSQAMDLQ